MVGNITILMISASNQLQNNPVSDVILGLHATDIKGENDPDFAYENSAWKHRHNILWKQTQKPSNKSKAPRLPRPGYAIESTLHV